MHGDVRAATGGRASAGRCIPLRSPAAPRRTTLQYQLRSILAGDIFAMQITYALSNRTP
jgi:hypothetical protein